MPKRHNLRHARVRRRLAVRSGAHWLGLAGAGLLLAGGSANANPLGGQVTAGSATIGNSSPAQLDIQQSTDRAVIDWQSFNIAVGERTQFHQPAASSWTLNRVNSPNPSTIAGYLGANGSLVLVNPSGVVFSKGSQVNVNSLIATPSGISNANFMAGKMRFDQPGNPNARVENAGTITVAQKGLAALVAPSVANSGLIQAKLGKVVLAGAATYTLDFYGDGLINFDVGPKVATVPVGPDGKPVKSLVSNTGTIDAAGGTVILTADAVSGILENVIDSPGTISARTTTTPAGSVSFGDIKIDAGEGNQARLGGTLDVSARAPGQRGGTAVVTGGSVRLTETARVYAQGPAGGGKVRIGGGPHGTDTSVRNAQTTVIDAGAVIDASATGNGNGGNIAVWSDGSTTFNGAIYAKGGPNGGNGGWVETSGKGTLNVGATGLVDTSALHGVAGTWLLDPDSNIDITNATSNVTCSGTPLVCSPSADSSTLNAATIANSLNGGTSVTVTTSNLSGTQPGNITVDAPVSWTTATSLSLNAAGSIAINAAISGTNSSSTLALIATGGSVTQSGTGTIQVGALVGSSAAGTALTLANNFVILGSWSNTASGNISIANANPVGALTGGTISNAAAGGTITLTESGGGQIAIGGGAVTTSNGTITIQADSMVISSPVNSGAARTILEPFTAGRQIDLGTNPFTGALGLAQTDLNNVTAAVLQIGSPGAGNIAVGQPISNPAGWSTLSLVNNGIISEVASGSLTLPNLRISSTGPVGLTGPNNIGTLASDTTGALSFSNGANALNIGVVDGDAGIVTSNSAIALTSGNLSITQQLNAGSSSVTLTASGTIGESGAGLVSAGGTLTTSSVGGTTLTGVNTVGSFNGTNTNAGDITLANTASPLTVSGISQSGGNVTIANTGDLSLTGDITAGSLVVSLFSSGAISQSAGVITAGLLTGQSATGATLNAANLVNTFGGFANTTSGNIAFTNAQSFATAGEVHNGAAGGTIALAESAAGGTLTVGGAGVTSNTGNITLLADRVSLGAAVNAITAVVELQPLSGGRAIDVGTNSDTSHLGLLQADLNHVTAGVLRIGDLSTTGNITVTAPITDVGTGWTTLSLLTGIGGGISQNSGATLTVTNLQAAGNNGVTLNENNVVSTLAGASASGTFSFVDSTNLTVGSVDTGLGFGFGNGIITQGQAVNLTVNVPNDSLTINQAIDTTHNFGVPSPGGANIFLTADNMALNNNSPSSTINAGTGGVVTLAPFTPAQTIALGGPDAAGQLGIDDNDLSNITAARVQIGSLADTTGIAVDGTINRHAGYSTMELVTGGPVIQITGSLSVANLALVSGGGINLTNAGNDVDTLAFNNTAGPVGYTDTNAMAVGAAGTLTASSNTGTTTSITAGGNLTISAALSSAGTVTLVSGGGISETPGITAPSLSITAVGPVSMTDANQVGTLAASVTGAGNAFTFRNDSLDLTIGTVGALSGITTNNGAVTLTTTTSGNILVNQVINAGSSTVTLTPSFAGGTIIQNSTISGTGGVTLTADQMSLVGGTINGGAAIVELQPFTTGKNIDLGTNPSAGNLALAQADLNTITAGVLRIGNLTSSGNITVTAPITDVGTGWNTLSLLTEIGTGISQNPGATLTVTNLNAAGNTGVSLNQNNVVTTLAGATESGALVFTNSGNLTVGSVDPGLPGGVGIGIITQAQPVSLTLNTANALLTVSQAIDTTHSFGGSASQGANITLVADQMSLGAAVNGGTGGIVDLRPFSLNRAVDVGTNPAGVLGLLQSDLNEVTASILRIGDLTTTGNLTVTAPITNVGTGWNTLSLLTGNPGTISQNAGATLTVPSLNAEGATGVALTEANAVSTLAGASLGTFHFVDTIPLKVDSVDPTLGFGGSGIITAGQIILASTANTSLTVNQGLNSHALGGSGADIALTFNGMSFNAPIDAGTANVGLENTGTAAISQLPGTSAPITASGLLVLDFAGPATMALTGGNAVSTIAATLTGGSLNFNDTAHSLTVGSVTSAPLGITSNGILTGNGDLALSTTTSGDITISQTINAGTGTVSLTSAGAVTEAPPVIAANLDVTAVGNVSMLDANQVGNLAADVTGAGSTFAFRNSSTPLVIGTVLGINGITTNGGEVLVKTTGSGDVSLIQKVDTTAGGTAAPNVVTFNLVGNLTQAAGVPGITASGLQLRNSTGATTISLAGDNAVDKLAAFLSPGPGTLKFNNTAHNLAVDSVTSTLDGSTITVSGIFTSNGTVGLSTTTSGDIALNQPIIAGTGSVGFEPAGNITQLTGPVAAIISTGAPTSGVEIFGTGGTTNISLRGDNQVDNLSATLSGTGTLAFNNMSHNLAVGSVTGVFPNVTVTSFGILTNDDVALSTTTSGSIQLNHAIDVAAHTVSLVSAGSIGQAAGATAPITASGLLVQSANTVALPGDNHVNNLAAQVINSTAGDTFLFNDTSTNLDVTTVTASLAPLTLSGITTNNNEIALHTTTSGNIGIDQPINAGTGVIALDAEGAGATISQPTGAAGKITADGLLLLGVGGATVTLPGDNAVNRLAGTIGGTGTLKFNDTSNNLTVNFVSSTLLGITSFGVFMNNGDIALSTTTSGNIQLSQPVNALAHTVSLVSAGTIGQPAGSTGKITANGLLTLSAGLVSLPGDNAVANLAAQVTGSGASFLFNDTSTALDVTTVTAPLAGLTLAGIITNNGAVTVETTTSGNLTLASNISAGSGAVTLTSGGSIAITGQISGGSLSATAGSGGTINLDNAAATIVSTSGGGESYNSPVVLQADTTVDDTSTGNITFASTVNGGFGLVATTGGTLSFNGVVGGTTPLATLNATGGTIALGADITNTGALSLTSTNSGATLGLPHNLTGSAVSLNSAGQIAQTGGIITAATLTGNSVGGASLTDLNLVGTFGPFSNTVSGLLAFTDAQALATAGTVSSAGNLTLTTTSGGLTLGGNVSGSMVTLMSEAAITQSGGVLTAGTLTGNSVGATSLTGANLVSGLGNFSSGGTGFTLDNTVALTQATGTTVNAGSGTILIDNGGAAFAQNGTLTTTNAGAAAVTIQNIGALSVGTISAASGTVVLGAASAPVGTTTETGIITAANLTGNASGSVMLTGNNLIANLGAFSSGNNNLTLNDTTALNVAGAVNAGTGTVTLTVSGTIGEPSPGAITANLLTGNARDGVSLIGPNKINLLGPFANNVSGLLNFNNVQALTAGGLSSAGGILLTTTSGGLTLNGDLSSPGQSVSLFSAGGIIQTAGAITAGMLTGSSAGATNLPDANLISGLGTFATGGAFTLFNTVTLTQTAGATVNAGSSPILIDNGGAAFNQAGTLTTAGTGTAVTIENTGTLSVGTITAPSGTVVLGTAGGAVGPITETGIITANLLIGNSVAGASLTDANAVNALGPFINAGSGLFAFTDAEALTTSGIVSSAGGISLTTTSGNLTLNADLSSPGQNVGLISAGTITQTGGAIAAGTLSTQSSGGTTLNGENSIGTLAASTNTGSGGFLLNDVAALTISGPVNAGTDNLVITSAGKLSVGGALNAGTDIDLTGAGVSLAAAAGAGRDVKLVSSGGDMTLSASATAGRDLALNTLAGDITINAGQAAGRNLLGTADGPINLIGTFSLNAGTNLVLVSNGAFTQRGTLTVNSPDLVIASDGRAGRAQALLDDLLAASGGLITNANIIKGAQFAPGTASNAISFDTHSVDATGSVVLLFADTGTLSGTLNARGLGVSGIAGSADLRGSVDGNPTQTAAQLGFINPRTQNEYQFNGCAIGSATCVILPNLVPIQPQSVSQIDILVARPSEDDLDAPLVNIFDEERLCEQSLRLNPDAVSERCRW